VKTITNRPTSEFPGNTIAAQLEGKAGSRREFGRLLDQMMSRTRKPRRRK
jgi:hypothetical protein